MRRGAYVGAVVGCLGWLIGLAAVCLATGETDVLGRVLLPGVAVSLGIAGVFLVTGELAARSFGPGRERRLLLWGVMVFLVGVLVLLMNHWIAPLIDASPGLRDAMARLGGIYRVADAWPAALMAVGVAILGLVLVRMRRRA
jgi:hypothetical protein